MENIREVISILATHEDSPFIVITCPFFVTKQPDYD